MTTTSESRVCACEECRALRTAEDAPGSGETVGSFEHGGSTYEIDHLGIGSGSQWGEFAVYCDGEEVAEFAIADSVLRPGSRPAGLPVSPGELIRLARQALGRPLPSAPRAAWPRSRRPSPGRRRLGASTSPRPAACRTSP